MVGGKLNDYDPGMPCMINLWTGDGQPPLNYTLVNDETTMTSGLDVFFTTQFLCQHNSSDLDFDQVVNLEWELNLEQFYFNVTDNMTMYFRLDSLQLSCLGYSNTTEKISLFTLKNVYLPAAKRIIKKKINKPFLDGPIPVGGALESKGLGILNLAEMAMWAELNYLLFAITP